MGRCSCWHHRSSRPRRPSRARGAAPPQRPRGAPCSRRRGRPGGPEARPRERGDFGRRARAPLAIVAHCHSAGCVDPVRSNPRSPQKRPRAAGARGWAGARGSPAPAVISPARGCDLTGVRRAARGAGRRRAGDAPWGVDAEADLWCLLLSTPYGRGAPSPPRVPAAGAHTRTTRSVSLCDAATGAAGVTQSWLSLAETLPLPLGSAPRVAASSTWPPVPCLPSPSVRRGWARRNGAARSGALLQPRAGTGGPGVRSEVPAGTAARHASFASPPSRLPAAAAVAVGGGRRPTRPWPKLGRDGATTGQRGGHPAGSPSGPTVGPRRWRSLCVGGGGGAAASDGVAASTNAAVWGDAGVGGTRRHRSAAPARRRLSISTQIVRTRAGWDTLPLCWRVCVVDARYCTVDTPVQGTPRRQRGNGAPGRSPARSYQAPDWPTVDQSNV